VYVERHITVTKNAHLVEESGEEEETDNDSTSAERDIDTTKTICYKDVTLLLLPNPAEIRDLLAIEVNL
jgi:hypothetical protein